jgi:hypothetical protein
VITKPDSGNQSDRKFLLGLRLDKVSKAVLGVRKFMRLTGKNNQILRVEEQKTESGKGFKGPSRTSGTMIDDNPKSAP